MLYSVWLKTDQIESFMYIHMWVQAQFLLMVRLKLELITLLPYTLYHQFGFKLHFHWL